MRKSYTKKNSNTWILYMVLITLIPACKEDPYYARPDSLEPVIYKQLEERGNFKSYLACLDRAGYKDVLSHAGYFTVFAPTDEAFSSFLSEHNISKVEDMSDELVDKIVTYSVVYNGYSKEQLDDFQSTDSLDWISDIAFKRRTAYYNWIHKDTVDGSEMYVADMNAVGGEEAPAGTYHPEDYNNKHIPYFTSNFFSKKKLSGYDYNYFFPNSTFSGFNVVDAEVLESDLYAENGVLHIINKVIAPLPSLDELVAGNPQYSEFKKLLDKYLVEYSPASDELLYRYEQASGTRQNIFIKEYPTLNFAPNCENYLRYGLGQDYDAQIDGWTIFVPTNAALHDFYNTKFLEHYSSLDAMPQQLISELVNAHMFRTTVWPSKFDITVNPFGEPARFDPESNVVEKKIGSNGIFYGVDKVQETDGFYTLLGDIYLNPEYSLMLQALYTTSLYAIVKNTNLKFTVFMVPNTGFESLGFSYDDAINTWYLNNEFLGNNASQALNRIINLHIIVNKEIDDFSGTGFIQTYGDEYIRYSGGYAWCTGNKHENPMVIPTDKKERSNGVSFVIPDMLYYSSNNIGYDLKGNTSYSKFYQYLARASDALPGFLYDKTTYEITNFSIADPNTLLVPNDTAIDAAVRDGYLPPLPSTYFTEEELDMVAKFVWYHSLNGIIIVPENEISGDVKTLYKTVDGSTYVTVNNEGGNILFFDKFGNTATVIDPNNTEYTALSNNAVIHLVSNYLRY
jgi:uncharacterized surface protein with fasciclin (FAS1) repeats